jgi:WD40 repeat protein
VYKNGSWGEPYYTSPFLGVSSMFKHALQIADADNDVGNGNELIIGPGYHVEMYRWTGNEFVKLWESAEFNGGIWSVDVGDADNDGENEIVLSAFLTNAPIILEYLGNNSWGDEQLVDPVDINCMDISRVRDSDNLMDEWGNYNNEIIAGGCNKKLMIWKYNSNANYYESVFVSDPLYDFTQGVDAGDFDNDGENEVIVGTAGPDGLIYILKYMNGEYSSVGSWSGGGCINLSVGNLDNDPEDEVVLGYEFEGGIKIFDYFEGQLTLAFSFPCGEYLEIK